MSMQKTFHPLITGLAAWACLSLSCAASEPKHVRNDEFGMVVTFPSASRVCTALSGDHAHGFYAWYGTGEKCERRNPTTRVSAMAVYASYNSLNWTSPWQELPSQCQTSQHDAVISPTELDKLSFRHGQSAKCIARHADGSISIDIVALSRDQNSGVAKIIYHASFLSYSDRIQKDLPMFRDFMASIDINIPD